VADANGSYIFRGLPPGTYKAVFSLTGFATIERSVPLEIGQSPDIDATMTVATVEESITVTGVAPSILTTTTAGANYRNQDFIDKLPMGRTLAAVAELAPGLTDNTPNANQVTISGAFAYDNVFLLNGVDINDNLFGTANNLFIEDAVEETQVLTSGISAEYGRFSGGVVNAVTKRGGNTFSGSFRTDLTNSAWTEETPFEKERSVTRPSTLNKDFQATLGGPIVKDNLWFFAAGRRAVTANARTLSNTGTAYTNEITNTRFEGKLTWTVTANHTVTAGYITNKTLQDNQPSINPTASIDLRTLIPRELPNDLFVANYSGVLSSNLFAELQYSQKKFGFRNAGGTSKDIKDSPFMSLGLAGIPSGRHYNAPYFDANDPEDRNNRQFAGSLSYFLSTSNLGRHDIKVGAEHFTTTRTAGNSQTSTGYVFQTDPKVVGGQVQFDANNRIIPTFVPGVTRILNWLPVIGASIDITTLSVYINDRWHLNDRLAFNVGARFEQVTSAATGVQQGADSKAVVPRLSATFDVMGDGRHVASATYSHYAGKAAETQIGDNSNVGVPNLVIRRYSGPAGEGLNFAPGFDLANYATIIGGSFPVDNVSFGADLRTPVTKEWTLQYGAKLGNKGEIKGIYTNRKTTKFLDDFIEIANGRTTVVRDGRTFGTFDNVVIRNTDVPKRAYQGLQFLGNYRLTDRWTIGGHYTLQIKNDGNFEGEGANTPGSYSLFGDRPEFYVDARNRPEGRLDDFQRDKARAWTYYNLDMGRAGSATLSLLYRLDSALTYSLSAANQPFSAIQKSRNPGYATPPITQAIFFGERGSEFYNGSHLFDMALSYDIPIWKSIKPWFKAEVRNMFNADPLTSFDATISVAPGSPVDADGIPTQFVKGANFGKATSLGNYPLQRTFQAAVGFRF
jgi:hypothetical protein